MSQYDRLATASGALLLLGLLAGPSAAQCSAADSLEDNDSCASAAVIAPGLHVGLSCQGPNAAGGVDPDYYRVTIGAGDTLSIAVLFASQATTDLDLHLYDPFSPNCGDKASALRSSTTSTDDELLTWTNTTAGTLDAIIAVTPKDGSPVICATYSLDVNIGPDPCSQGVAVDDVLEQNDACGFGTVLAGNGAWIDLFVSPSDLDYYTATVQPGEIFQAEISYDAEVAQLGMELFDDPGCANQVGSAGWGGYDALQWRNSTAAPVDLTWRVFVQPGERCNLYDMNLSVAPDPCVLGANDSFAPNASCATAPTIAAGLYPDLYVSGWTADCFKISVPAGDVLNVDIHYVSGFNEDLGIRLYADSACSNQLDHDFWGGNNSVTTGSGSLSVQDYWVRVVTGLGSGCNSYDLVVSMTPDPCLTAVDDALEPNDSCVTAATLTPGVYTNLLCTETDPDCYKIVLQPGERIITDLSFAQSGATLSSSLQDALCVTLLDYGGAADGSHTEWANYGGLPVDVVLKVEVQDAAGRSCGNYDLIVDVIVDPCLSTPDDVYEDNDDCANAVVLPEGLHQDLYVHKVDPDYYLVNVLLGDTLDLTLDYDTAGTDVRLLLYEITPTNGGTCGDGSSYEAFGFGSGQTRSISWLNDIASGTFVVAVSVTSSSSSDCTGYSLAVSGGGQPFATAMCFGDGMTDAGQGFTGCPCANNSAVGAKEGCLNSTGHGATIAATGSNVFAADDLGFEIAQARPNQPSLLVQGSAHVAIPFKDGILCMGNPTERVEVVILDAAGEGSTTSSIVTEGNIAGPGITRYYQAWYRDPQLSPCGTGSNFTHGLRIDWI
ncbi:MAG: PPC domain-containing protein [Planctomycetes bacterium]|nr:PPC domain-containing protein [Planctomycetota bacterium]MCB9903715.1 PPC domain-containing protein [Planctomycetota bacterium]